MPLTTRLAGFAVATGAAAVLLAPAAYAADSATPSPTAPELRAPVATPSVSRGSDQRAVPTASPTAGGEQGGGADIDVPAGRATVPSSGHGAELTLVALAGGGALLLASGTVVAVARRRA